MLTRNPNQLKVRHLIDFLSQMEKDLGSEFLDYDVIVGSECCSYDPTVEQMFVEKDNLTDISYVYIGH